MHAQTQPCPAPPLLNGTGTARGPAGVPATACGRGRPADATAPRLRPGGSALLLVGGLVLAPRAAWAQDILGLVLALAAVPLLNAVLVLLFALVHRSFRAFLLHTGLVSLWVVLFWLFASYTPSDFLAWLPFGLSIAHSLYLGFRAVRTAFRPARDRRQGRQAGDDGA